LIDLCRDNVDSLKAVIFAGGLGTRMREETEFRPKPMVEIGGKPVLWHIMDNFSNQGIKDFVVLAGYRANLIKEYFLHLREYSNDIRISTNTRTGAEILGHRGDGWTVSVLDTGTTSETGQRLRLAREEIGSDRFICTYGDGLASVSVAELISSHEQSGKPATVTLTKPLNRFGIVEFDTNFTVTSFAEKSRMSSFISIGFFVFDPMVFDFLDHGNEPLETGLLPQLVSQELLNGYIHEGFWEPMDTFREYQKLNSLWESGSRPWQVQNET
jgi:glucose-1-phosphate cytidylyltransferase